MYVHVHNIPRYMYIEIVIHKLTADTLHDDLQKLKQPTNRFEHDAVFAGAHLCAMKLNSVQNNTLYLIHYNRV